MASPAEPTDRADQIFRIGPEDLIARSTVIVAGPVSKYSKEVRRSSAAGAEGIPLEWTVHAQIDRPVVLKGAPPPAPIHFSRRERSFLLPPDSTVPIWEMNFGELKPEGQAVLFFEKGQEPRVVPGGDGDADLVQLVRDIVRIQTLQDAAAQRRIWLQYVTRRPSPEGTKAALRSAIRLGAHFEEIATAIRELPPGPDIRAFAFGLVAFHISAETWGKDSAPAMDFLCQVFRSEKDVEQQLRYLQSFKMLLSYTDEEPRQPSRQPLRKGIAKCLEAWAAPGLRDPQLEQEYRQIREIIKR